VKHKATARFWNHFWALPTAVQEIARKNYQILRDNPRYPYITLQESRKTLVRSRDGGSRGTRGQVLRFASRKWHDRRRIPATALLLSVGVTFGAGNGVLVRSSVVSGWPGRTSAGTISLQEIKKQVYVSERQDEYDLLEIREILARKAARAP
jgi:hypothetical protein